MNASTPVISVVIPTYNRGELLADAIRAILEQEDAPEFELLVVDNNSTDGTREIVERFINEGDPRVRYVFEGTQGVSHGRNAGIRESRADIIAFMDDDVRASPHWLAEIARGFAEFPEAAFIGGRIFPMWPKPVPRWLTREHWGPLALQDYGDTPFKVNPRDPVCLVSANLAMKRAPLALVGGFDPTHQHKKGEYAATEDQDLEQRVMEAGGIGVYWPPASMHAPVQLNRLEKAYHRKWHLEHGRSVVGHLKAGRTFDSNMAHSEGPSNGRSLFGVPFWTYRQFLTSGAKLLLAVATGRKAAAFENECWVREAIGNAQGFRRRHSTQ